MSDDQSTDSPLSRYLKKQGFNSDVAQVDPEERPSKTVEADGDPRLSSAPFLPNLESELGFGSPEIPSAVEQPAKPQAVARDETAAGPAGFWLRAFALTFDNLIILMICVPLYFFFPFLFSVPYSGFGSVLGSILGSTFYYFGYFLVVFFYFGWFYKRYGASPGKLVLDLKVRDALTHRHLGYVRTFFRETLGKMLSGMFFCMGFLIVVFRRDKRTLHDLIFGSEVVRVQSRNRES